MVEWEDISQNESVWLSLASSREKLLILDFDGTLAPFVPNPSDARPYPGVCELLQDIIDCGARVVFVTGRDCRELPGLLGLARPVEVWGSHGAERMRLDGVVETKELSPLLRQGLDEAHSEAEQAGYASALEVKPGCISFHLRGMEKDQREVALETVQALWSPIATRTGLTIHSFDGGLELRGFSSNKGVAVQTLMGEMAADPLTFYLGDDLTDEDAFVALGQSGIGVLVRRQLRQTAAQWWLRPPEELLAFLKMFARLCSW